MTADEVARIREAARRVAADAPELKPEQIATLRRILRPPAITPTGRG